VRIPIFPRLVKLFDPLVCGQNWPKMQEVLDDLTKIEDFFFVQIGANDGVIHDPLFHHIVNNQWSGILVEPVRYYFNRLKLNYAGSDQLIFENVAISDRDERREFYRLREGLEFLPQWTEGLGSFHLEVLMKHRWLIPNIKDYIISESVDCVSLQTLLNRNKVRKIDLVLIDTEGYDFEILKQINFDYVDPSVIIYEHKHISHKERRDSEALLTARGYRLYQHFSNTMACSF